MASFNVGVMFSTEFNWEISINFATAGFKLQITNKPSLSLQIRLATKIALKPDESQ